MNERTSPLQPSPYAAALGIRVVSAHDGQAHCEIADVAALPGNRVGAAHGGLLATLLDVALAAAVRSAAPDSRSIATVSLDLHYLAPGRGPLTANATALRVGRTLGFAQGAVVDAKGSTVAIASGSFKLERGRKDDAPEDV